MSDDLDRDWMPPEESKPKDLRGAAQAVIDAYRFNSDNATTARAMEALRIALAAHPEPEEDE